MVNNALNVYEEQLKSLVHDIRGVKIILDYDLAQLYGVETEHLKEAVRNNIDRFPPDFVFELEKEEYDSLRTQFESLKTHRGNHPEYIPYAFTQQGAAILSGILNSDRAVEVNISIMRAFIQLRQINFNYEEVVSALENMKEQIKHYEGKIDILELFMERYLLDDSRKYNK